MAHNSDPKMETSLVLTDEVEPPLFEEDKLINVLTVISLERLPKVLKCIDSWPFEAPANCYNWLHVLGNLKAVLNNAKEACPDLMFHGTKDTTCEHEKTPSPEEDQVLWTETVYQVLRFLGLMFANALEKQLFDGMDVAVQYLQARNERIVQAAVHVVAMRSVPVRTSTNPDSTNRDRPNEARSGTHDTQPSWLGHNASQIQQHLLQLVQIDNTTYHGEDWVEDASDDPSTSPIPSETLMYQYTEPVVQNNSSSQKVIQIPLPIDTNCFLHPNSFANETLASTLCEQLIAQFNVPSSHWFSLRVRIQSFLALRSRQARESLVLQRLDALLALIHIPPSTKDALKYLENHPELIRTVVKLIRVEAHDTIALQIRLAALQVLTGLVQDRSCFSRRGLLGRQSCVLSELGIMKGTPHGVFPSLIRFCISELGAISIRQARQCKGFDGEEKKEGRSQLGHSVSGTSEGETDMEMSLAVAFVQATTDDLSPREFEAVNSAPFRDYSNAQDVILSWIEGVLTLLQVVVANPAGASVLTENGIVPALLHVISVPAVCCLHRATITQCVRVLQATISNYATAAALYRDLNGVTIVVDRLVLESASVASCIPRQTASKLLTVEPIFKFSFSDTKRVLLSALFRLLSTSFHTQGVMSAGSTSRVIREDGILSKVLQKMFDHMDIFGATAIAEAAIVVTDIINNDPTSVNHIHQAGIADKLMKMLTRWDRSEFSSFEMLPPSSRLIQSLPSLLHAITLTKESAAKVLEYDPIAYLLDLFATPRYVLAPYLVLHSGLIQQAGTGVYQLMRQSNQFEQMVIKEWVVAIQKVIAFGKSHLNRSNEPHAATSLLSAQESQIALLRMTSNVLELLQNSLSKSDYAGAFAARGGVSSIIELYQLCVDCVEPNGAFSILNTESTSAQGPVKSAFQGALNSISMTLRLYGSQQPAVLLELVMQYIATCLTELRETHTALLQQDSAVFSSLSEEEIKNFFSFLKKEPEITRNRTLTRWMGLIGTAEWLVRQLSWLITSVQEHVQSRRIFVELTTPSKLSVLTEVFAFDQIIQTERATLEMRFRTQSDKNTDGWRIGSLLLLRFSVMARRVLCDLANSFVSTPFQQRRSADTAVVLAPHARELAVFLSGIVQAFVKWILQDDTKLLPLTFLLETLCQLLFESNHSQPNTLLLVQFMKHRMDSTTLMDAIFRLIRRVFNVESLIPEVTAEEMLPGTRIKISAFHIASCFVRRLSDLEALSSSPITSTLFHDPATRVLDVEPRVLTIRLQFWCTQLVSSVWKHEQFACLRAHRCILDVVAVAVTILKNRLDHKEHANAFGARRSDENARYVEPFAVDLAVVDSLTAMGFARGRVENAIRRIELNDVEFAMEWILSHPEDPERDSVEEASMEQELGAHLENLETQLELKCLEVLQCQASRSVAVKESYSCHQVAVSIAQQLEALFRRSHENSTALLRCFTTELTQQIDRDDTYTTTLAHVLLLMLHFDGGHGAWTHFVSVYSSLAVALTTALLAYLKRLTDRGTGKCGNDSSGAFILLLMDIWMEINAGFSVDPSELVEVALTLLNHGQLEEGLLHPHVAHAVFQLLVRLTKTYATALLFYEKKGMHLALHIHPKAAFPAYEQLTWTLIFNVLGAPSVVEHLAQEGIRNAMQKLTSRFGAVHPTRITPRTLLMEVAGLAAHNEEAFMQAMQQTVRLQQSDSGRTYVVLRDVDTERVWKPSKTYRQHVSAVVHALVERIQWLRQVESNDALCVGTYLFLLSQMVLTHSIASSMVAKAKLDAETPLIPTVLKDFLPSKELCAFLAIGKPDTEKQSEALRQHAFMSRSIRARVRFAHELLVNMAMHSDGCKHVVMEVIRLLERWANVEVECVGDDAVLAQLHAWTCVLSSLLWPKEKPFAWDAVAQNGFQHKFSLIRVLANALEKIDAMHPSAFPLSVTVLGPLALLTRPIVTRRIDRILHKPIEIETEMEMEASEDGSSESGSSSHAYQDVTMHSPASQDGSESDSEESADDGQFVIDQDEEDMEEEQENRLGEFGRLWDPVTRVRTEPTESSYLQLLSQESALASELARRDENADDPRAQESVADRLIRSLLDLVHAENGDRASVSVSLDMNDDELDAFFGSIFESNVRQPRESRPMTFFDVGNWNEAENLFSDPFMETPNRPPASSRNEMTHPLLQFTREREPSVPRISLSRHSHLSVLRDLQELSDVLHVQPSRQREDTQRPRNRLGLLEMDVLDHWAPTSAVLDPLRPLPRADDFRRLYRGNDRPGLRSRGTTREPDVRALASRLEQRLYQMEPRETEAIPTSEADANDQTAVSEPEPQERLVETASDSASVSALASTLDESSLRSPREPERPLEAPEVTPAPELLNFTLDLSGLEGENAPPEPEQTTQFIVCPEGMDPEVFASLPAEMQMEIMAQFGVPAASVPSHETQLSLDIENSNFDRETLEALPADIREEVLANERRERESETPADVSHAQDMDNASFVASLAPDLREEILSTCDDAFLETLPSDIRAEALILRERAVFRSAYQTQDARRGRNESRARGDVFRRPTLRRMITYHGSDVLGRRSSGRRQWSHRNSSNRIGEVCVPLDEKEDAEERILNSSNVKALCRLVYMSESIAHNRVFLRVVSNACLYPLTRACFRRMLLHIVTQPLKHPLIPLDLTEVSDSHPNGEFAHMMSSLCQASGQHGARIPVQVVGRVLEIFVALARHNSRFSVDLLQPHGMYSDSESTESAVSVFIHMLETSIVFRNGSNVDLLLELIELILAPLRCHRKDDSEEKEEEAKDEDDIEWIRVPQLELDQTHMDALVRVLCLNLCTPSMQERCVRIFDLLDSILSNRLRVLSSIIAHVNDLLLVQRYVTSYGRYESSAVLRSPQYELILLRLLHTLSDVCTSSTEYAKYCAMLPLDALWKALSLSLEEARTRGGLEEQESRNWSTRILHLTTQENVLGAETETETEADAEGMVIEGKSAGASCAMAALLARFLPMVEAFFVVNARDAASMPLKAPDTTGREEEIVAALRTGGFDGMEASHPSDGKGLSTSPKRSTRSSFDISESTRLANFVEANRVLLNILVREKPSLLDTSLAALIKMPQCRAYLDFDNKRTYFQNAMKKIRQTALRSGGGSSSVRISVRRDHIFEDSYYALRMRSGEELRRKLHIAFTGEEGIDAGGVTREWYMILAREIFNPNYVLFTSAADSPTFQPNALSYVNKDHLSYFEFVGKVIGKALADGQLLDAHFTRSFYKHMLQLPISYHDMEAIDPEYYRNLHSILEHPIASLGLELTFSAEHSNFGRVEIVDLIPNGQSVHVSDANKMEYVKLVTHHRMATGIRQQIDHFLKGFHQLVSPNLISIFNENELELLISGMPDIDIDDLRANTDYANYKPTDSVIRWFWSVLYSFTHEERALFLQFVTGTSKVPLEGFKALEGMRGTQKFNIHKAFGNPDALPSAHTCFNQLDLPDYENEEKLKQRLLLAIREGSEGFGFG
uniref:HECT-type E3 ubiquitin transferase n=1 Tax=Albugo laibachii Nc14 TaxID=890382 RepID=F0VZS8_9STRA|nr:HECT E3 ubiquitin ligase putative [Albugo laibachii Nc14]|eukprot:CCA14299.1 HECT E3 ubiquitin ligase putative [Albugo laibachii Nc14]